MRRALGVALTAALWLLPPPVLPTPSRTGPEGPPRTAGVEPHPGRSPGPTGPALARAQNRALLEGPFPTGGLRRGVTDGGSLLSEHESVRALALARIRAAGATIVRIPVDWRNMVSGDPPAGFDAADPADPSYHFARIDGAVLSTQAAGLTPLLVISHAPAFAEAPGRWPYAYPGSWAPSPAALRAFASALARRYDGSFPDPLAPGRALPRVRLLQAWNEPNLARYLEPQWVAEGRHWSAFSPRLYRQLLNGFYAGVKAVEPGDVVVAAGLAPDGERAGLGRMAPVAFLESLLCVGEGAAARSCPERSHFDVMDFHPLSVGDPDLAAISSLDVGISDAGKITRLLARARHLHTVLPAGPKPLWVTELNWESAPQVPWGVPPALQAGWVSRALHRLWVAGVSLVAWDFLLDPYPGVAAATPTGGIVEYPRAAGLYTAGPGGDPEGAVPKPFLQGFSLPFDPLRVSRAQVRVWALLRAPGQPGLLQRRDDAGAWIPVAGLRAGPSGVVNVLLRLRGSMRLRLLSGAEVSPTATVAQRRGRL
jgi:hypothetical protein